MRMIKDEEINIEELVSFRRNLHQHPELSGKEEKTSEKIFEFVKDCAPDTIHKNIGGYGIVATWQGAEEGKHLLLRADMDALPIMEINSLSYKSTDKNVAHLCGHDGHSTILCGVAKYLSTHNLAQGKVSLIWQPAEETGAGAAAMLSDDYFKNLKIDFCYALHNMPGLEIGKLLIKEGAFTPAVRSAIIKLTGRTAHASQPHTGINPAAAIAEIIQSSANIQKENYSTDEVRLITPIHITMGELAYGVSAGYGEIHFTLRSGSNAVLDKLDEALLQTVNNISEKYLLKSEVVYTEMFAGCHNDANATALLEKAFSKNNLPFTIAEKPMPWGEDFGLFSTKYPGSLFGLGSGDDCAALHDPHYDFPDEIISTGINAFTTIVKEVCG